MYSDRREYSDSRRRDFRRRERERESRDHRPRHSHSPSPRTASHPHSQPWDMVELGNQFSAQLSQLVSNSRKRIEALTELAAPLKPYARQVVDLIEREMLNASGERKLTLMYLIDSIVRNNPGEYAMVFSQHLPALFEAAFVTADASGQQCLIQLLTYWDTHFPPQVLTRLHAIATRHTGGGGEAAGHSSPRYSPANAVRHSPPAAAAAAAAAAASSSASNHHQPDGNGDAADALTQTQMLQSLLEVCSRDSDVSQKMTEVLRLQTSGEVQRASQLLKALYRQVHGGGAGGAGAPPSDAASSANAKRQSVKRPHESVDSGSGRRSDPSGPAEPKARRLADHKRPPEAPGRPGGRASMPSPTQGRSTNGGPTRPKAPPPGVSSRDPRIKSREAASRGKTPSPPALPQVPRPVARPSVRVRPPIEDDDDLSPIDLESPHVKAMRRQSPTSQHQHQQQQQEPPTHARRPEQQPAVSRPAPAAAAAAAGGVGESRASPSPSPAASGERVKSEEGGERDLDELERISEESNEDGRGRRKSDLNGVGLEPIDDEEDDSGTARSLKARQYAQPSRYGVGQATAQPLRQTTPAAGLGALTPFGGPAGLSRGLSGTLLYQSPSIAAKGTGEEMATEEAAVTEWRWKWLRPPPTNLTVGEFRNLWGTVSTVGGREKAAADIIEGERREHDLERDKEGGGVFKNKVVQGVGLQQLVVGPLQSDEVALIFDGLSRLTRRLKRRQTSGAARASELSFDKIKLDLDIGFLQQLHEGRPRQCALCGVRFRTAAAYQQHIQNHFERNEAKRQRKRMQEGGRLLFAELTDWMGESSTVAGCTLMRVYKDKCYEVEGKQPPARSKEGAEGEGEAIDVVEMEEDIEEEEADTEEAMAYRSVVPADANKSICCLSSEPFERAFSETLHDWVYLDAIAIDLDTFEEVAFDPTSDPLSAPKDDAARPKHDGDQDGGHDDDEEMPDPSMSQEARHQWRSRQRINQQKRRARQELERHVATDSGGSILPASICLVRHSCWKALSHPARQRFLEDMTLVDDPAADETAPLSGAAAAGEDEDVCVQELLQLGLVPLEGMMAALSGHGGDEPQQEHGPEGMGEGQTAVRGEGQGEGQEHQHGGGGERGGRRRAAAVRKKRF